MWVTAHEAVLSRVSSARTPRLPAFPQLRYAPRPPAQKPIGVTSSPFRKPAGSTGKRRGDRGGDAVTIRARDLLPPFPPPRPSRSREITRSDARITSIQQGNQHGAASPTHPHSRLGESSAQVPFKLLCSLQFLQIHAVMPHGRFSCPSRSCAFFWFFSEEIERSDEFSCLILVGCNPFSLPRFLVGLVVLVVSM